MVDSNLSSLFFSGGHTTHDFKTLKITWS